MPAKHNDRLCESEASCCRLSTMTDYVKQRPLLLSAKHNDRLCELKASWCRLSTMTDCVNQRPPAVFLPCASVADPTAHYARYRDVSYCIVSWWRPFRSRNDRRTSGFKWLDTAAKHDDRLCESKASYRLPSWYFLLIPLLDMVMFHIIFWWRPPAR
jgi:hypothetical protein